MAGHRRFDAVFFDLGYTRVDLLPFDGLVSRLCAEHGVLLRPEEVAAAHRGIDTEIAAFQGSGAACSLFTAPPEDCRCFWLALFGRVLNASGRDYRDDLPDVLYERFIRGDGVEVFPDVVPTLTRLRTAGILVGAISDWEVWCEGMLRELRLSSLLDFALISGAVSLQKPSPRLYRLALERAGVPAECALHVGDDPELDCEAARSVELTPVLLDRAGQHAGSGWMRFRSLAGFQSWFFGDG